MREKNGFSFGLIFPISSHPKWSYYTISQCCHKAGNNCSLIDCFVNALCKVCWRKLHSSVELQSCESSGWKKEPLSHPPTPPPALLPPFAADLSGQPSPSLHSFSCRLWGCFFLHPPLTTRVTSELSYQTATHCCIFISKASWCFLAGMKGFSNTTTGWIEFRSSVDTIAPNLFYWLIFILVFLSMASPPEQKEKLKREKKIHLVQNLRDHVHILLPRLSRKQKKRPWSNPKLYEQIKAYSQVVWNRIQTQ